MTTIRRRTAAAALAVAAIGGTTVAVTAAAAPASAATTISFTEHNISDQTSTSDQDMDSPSATSNWSPTSSCKAASRSATTGKATPSPGLAPAGRRAGLGRRGPRPRPDRPVRAGHLHAVGTWHLPARGHRRHRKLPGRRGLCHCRARQHSDGHHPPHPVTVSQTGRARPGAPQARPARISGEPAFGQREHTDEVRHSRPSALR